MRRFTWMTALACLLSLPVLAAQAPPAPVQKAKYIAPVKGTATIDVMQVASKRVGKEIVTLIKVKNTSNGAINLLKVDEYWYDNSRPAKMVTGAQYAHKKAPIQPGEIVEIELRSPVIGNPVVNQMLFRHAYGEAKATKVKAFK